MDDLLQKSAENYEPRGHLDPDGFEQNVSFVTTAPPADLAPFVEHFWSIRWERANAPYFSEQVMHRPYVDVFISAEESGIQGTFHGTRTYVAGEGGGRILGVRFRPSAFHAFWSGSLADLKDKNISVEQVFPGINPRTIAEWLAHEDTTVIQQLARVLREAHPQPDPNIEIINDIIAAIEADDSLQTVKAVGRRFGRSERWLQQLFQDYVGIGLKWFLQRHRLLSAAEHIRRSDQPDWAAIAYDLGYSSQQHFISDFKQVLGKTPVQYKKDLTRRDQRS